MNPRLSRAKIEELQLVKLDQMCIHLRRWNPFYKARFKPLVRRRWWSSLETFFERMPFTTKVEIVDDQAANPPYGTNLTYPLARYTRYCQTSGTSGSVPIRWLDTNSSWGWMVDCWVRVLEESGVRLRDRIFFAFSFGPFLGFWSAFEAGVKMGCLCFPGGGMSTDGRLRSIIDNQATVLCCTPTYAIRLGEAAAEQGIDLSQSQVRLVMAAGEPGASIPAVRTRIERLWPGARVKDHHGMTETGPVTYECPVRPRVLHVIESGYIPEVIDPETGLHAGPGETGELVLTNLGRVGSPLLRYRTGDLVKTATEPVCSCGSAEMALEGGIIGRVDDMVVIRGVNVHPSAVEEIVRRFDDAAEFRALLRNERGMADLSLEIEPVASCLNPEALAGGITRELRSAFNLRVPVTTVAPGSLPRFEMKAKRWIRVDAGDSIG